ncbi:TPA: hypothetical protein ACYSAQ_003493 [Morganella morganii]
MKKNICTVLTGLAAGLLLSIPAYAGCDLKKAARNKMLSEKTGISGSCNTEKAVRNNVTGSTDNILNINTPDIPRQITGGKNKVTDTAAQISAIPDNTVLRESKNRAAQKK